MTVLVTGAAGFLGGHVLGVLRAEGRAFRATDRPGATHGDIVPCDLLADPLDDLLGGVTHVVHAAGRCDLGARRGADLAVNVEAPRRLAAAAARAGVRRFLHVSSAAVHGASRGAPLTEAAPLRPRNPYERSKARGEASLGAVAARSGLDLVVLRPTGLYGPRGRYGLGVVFAMAAALRAMRGGGVLAGLSGGPRVSYLHVEDAARAAVHLLEHPDVGGHTFLAADDVPVAWGDLLARVGRWSGLETPARLALGRPAFATLARLWRDGPAGLRAAWNRRLEGAWGKVVRAHDLAPALGPRLDRYAADYAREDLVVSNRTLRQTGFALRHPDPWHGLAETLAWYRVARWLPVHSSLHA